MFLIDTGKVCVLAESRCGNTSMHYFFNQPLFKTEQENSKEQMIELFCSSYSQRVLVLRHPFQRFKSALNYYDKYGQFYYDQYAKMTEEERREQPSYTSWKKHFASYDPEEHRRLDILNHAAPYLEKIVGVDFKIIKFERLSEYLGSAKHGPVTDTMLTQYDDKYTEFVSKKELEFEEFLYYHFLKTKTEITPQDWKQKTAPKGCIKRPTYE